MTLKIGSKLKGNSFQYVIEGVLGQGTFGVTYKAKGYSKVKGAFGDMDVELPQPIAIKEFFMRDVNQRDENGSIMGLTEGTLAYNYAQKFRKEAERLAAMRHPNIVKVMDFVEANNTFYYVMDFIDGEDVSHYMNNKPLQENEAIKIILDVASALQYMHEEHKMLHLDLKPGNIMRRRNDGHIFLIDFGLSKHYNDDGQPDTSTTIGLGTEGYAPIEQGKRATSQNSFRPTIDVYALGGTLFKMLTSETPPPASDILEDEELLSEILGRHGINLQLQKIIVNAMMPSAKKRTASVGAFMSAILQLYGDELQTEESTQYDDYISRPDIDVYNLENPANDESRTLSKDESGTIVEKLSSNVITQQDAFVDLGLSVKWSCNNMEADIVTASGKLSKGIETNNLRNWNDVPVNFGGTNYDPVSIDLGKNYRMPTRSEWKELINECDWKWAEIDGITGYLVTAKNGNNIFLPHATGYWSCTKAETMDFQCVYYLFFNSYDIDMVYNVYDILRCIRPVQENKD